MTHVRSVETEVAAPSPAVVRHLKNRRTALTIGLVARILVAVCILAFLATPLIGIEASTSLIALAGAAVMATSPTSPTIGLVGVALLCTIEVPMRTFVIVPLGLPFNAFSYALIAVTLLAVGQVARLRDQQSRWLLAFVLVVGLQVSLSTDRVLGVQATLELAVAFMLTGLFVRSVRWRELLAAMTIVNPTAGIVCLLSYILFPSGSLAINANALSHVSIAGLGTIALAASVPGLIRRWSIVGLLAAGNIALVFVLGSRSGLIVASLLGLYIVARSPRLKWKGYTAVLVVGLFIFGSTRFIEEYAVSAEKWSRLTDPTMSVGVATSGRSDIALVGWYRFLDNPFGTGSGSFSTYDPGAVASMRVGVAAHSGWVKTLAENGVPGLIMFVGYLLCFLRRPQRGAVAGRGLGVCVFLVLSVSFMFTEFQSKAIWLFAAGATMLLVHPAVPASRRRVPGASVVASRTG